MSLPTDKDAGALSDTSMAAEAPLVGSQPRRPRLQIRLAVLLVLMIPLGFGFIWLRKYLDSRPIEWIPYSKATLDQNLAENRTVMINFTARWNLTNAMHERYVFRTPQVGRWIRAHDVVPVRADWTNDSPEIRAALQAIDQRTIPVLAVYPAATPDDPIVLSGEFTDEQVLQALREAERR